MTLLTDLIMFGRTTALYIDPTINPQSVDCQVKFTSPKGPKTLQDLLDKYADNAKVNLELDKWYRFTVVLDGIMIRLYIDQTQVAVGLA